MRTRDAMLKDALEARRRYAWLMEAKDMLVVRLAADIPDLLAALAEKDAEIERLATSRRSAWQEAERLRGDKRGLVNEESRLQARLNLRGAEIESLQRVAELALDFLITVGEYNSRQPEAHALGTAMVYGKEAGELQAALEGVGL